MNAVAPTDPDGHSAVYQEAAVELGKGIALGLVPFLGQAIDAYDTIESTLMLYNAKKPEDKESAQFDLVLALVGWVPGPGDGVRKTFRLVNKDPQRFAPVLFDLLRFVLQECGIQTSPEALLDELFNAGKLTAVLNEAKKGVEDATAFKSLPHWLQTVVLTALSQAAANLPMMLGIVEKRLKKWKKVQHNSSANVQSTGKAKQHLPDAKDGSTAQEGKNRAGHARTDSANNSQLAILDPSQLANELIGISGEHIADYMCLQKFGCGSGWGKHDDGGTGKWTKGNPDKDTPGKLSKKGKLYQLADGANGTGIDSVWHASGNNQGKPYAIVEAKASRLEDAPKFHRKKDWKPKINSKLGDNRRSMKEKIKSKLADDIIKDPSELLEPLEDDKVGAAPKKGGGKAGGKT